VIGLGRKQRVDRSAVLVAVDERLRRDEPARERDILLPRMGLAAQLDRRALRLAVAERAVGVHEDRRDRVPIGAVETGPAWEVHPAELLDRRHGRRLLARFTGSSSK
jgi:hypothetical protein